VLLVVKPELVMNLDYLQLLVGQSESMKSVGFRN